MIGKLNQFQKGKLVGMHTIILNAQDNSSSCIFARTIKLSMKNPYTISRGLDNPVQACKLVGMHTIFLYAWDHISGCIHARTFKLGTKHLQTISQAVYMLGH